MLLLEDFLWWVAGKKLSGRCLCVCMYVFPSVQALSPREPERLVGSGRANTRSMRRSGGKTMVPVSDQSVARATCHIDRANHCKKVLAKGAGQTDGRIRLKLSGLLATIGGLTLLG